MQRPLVAALLPLLLGACADSSLPDVVPYQSPADPQIADSAPRGINVIDGYVRREPVSPKPWQLLNEEQAPNKGAGS